jgi:hypothetical protein
MASLKVRSSIRLPPGRGAAQAGADVAPVGNSTCGEHRNGSDGVHNHRHERHGRLPADIAPRPPCLAQ